MVEAVEAEQILWGTKSEALTRGWTRLFEGRGMELILPMDSAEVTPVNRVKLTTRNYIGYNALGQAGYIDCRFVRFTIGR
jgi:CRISPR-associated protein (TIGR03984 family)